jgi:hypothetical protein
VAMTSVLVFKIIRVDDQVKARIGFGGGGQIQQFGEMAGAPLSHKQWMWLEGVG